MAEAVQIAWGSVPAPERSVDNYFADLSQCVARQNFGKGLKTLTSRSEVYDFKRDCVLDMYDLFALQGMPVEAFDLRQLSIGQAADLVGEGMFAPCIGSILMAYYLNPSGPWWDSESIFSTAKRQRVQSSCG